MLTEGELLERFLINVSAAVIKKAKEDAAGHGYSESTHDKRISHGEKAGARAFLASIAGPPRLRDHLDDFCSSLEELVDDRKLIPVSEFASWFGDYIVLLKKFGLAWERESRAIGCHKNIIFNVVHGAVKQIDRGSVEKLRQDYERLLCESPP